MRISIEQYLYGNYIKYNKMAELTAECFSGSDANAVNIFIDMNSMIKSLYRFSKLSIENYSVVTSSILNLCAHIRSYYENRHHVKTNIFIVYSTNCPSTAKQYVYRYNEKYETAINTNKVISDLIYRNLELLRILCPYLQDIFFIEDDFETSVVIYDLVLKNEANGNTYPNIVFSKDIFAYQLPAMKSNTVIFRSQKRDNQDVSWAVNNTNVIARYIADSRGKDIPNMLNPELLSLILALTNVPNRNIPSIFSISKAISILEEAIRNRTIINRYNHNILYLLDGMMGSFTPDIKDSVRNRFKAIDIHFQHTIYLCTPNAKNNTIGIKNLYDPETVKGLNNQYFRHNPIDLNRL